MTDETALSISDIAETLLAHSRRLGIRLATAESCTGGLIAGALTEIPGSSDMFDRGFVTYSNASKMEMLDVSVETLETFGAVSEEVAREMAEGALAHSDADITVAVTGIAGPGGSEFKPEGRVCFGLAATGSPTLVETIEFGAPGRSEVRQTTLRHALEMLLAALRNR
ncbi:CinA family protein [Aliiruegeria lutimaris]|uniref:Nicotinamide-nucleotide amidase n=1 Tax=Aliiruegeria lutimaris TaxID=571298 RepID=A0A1G9B4T4_9RHOB|nr:CinA family protein [Aliiruegeria lutimaris]SDK34557.1 nicotinamide-nucleotide amidase [Aliiruegeria lutimaris]